MNSLWQLSTQLWSYCAKAVKDNMKTNICGWVPQNKLFLCNQAVGRIWSMELSLSARGLEYFLISGRGLSRRRQWHPTPPHWKIPWTEEPGRLQSMGSLRIGHDWATSLSLFTLMHWKRKWQPTPVFLPGESQRRGNLVGCRLWGHTELDTTEVTQQQQQQQCVPNSGLSVWEPMINKTEGPQSSGG